MAHFKLAARAREQLQQIARASANARYVRRAQALLWLDAGCSFGIVAGRLGVSRRTIHRWRDWYEDRTTEPVAERIHERTRPGGPAHKRQVARRVIERVWPRDPRRYGYRALVWTAPMLRCEIRRRTEQVVSVRTVRRALRDLRYRYKRPRLVLARRLATWRQAKGGLNAG